MLYETFISCSYSVAVHEILPAVCIHSCTLQQLLPIGMHVCIHELVWFLSNCANCQLFYACCNDFLNIVNNYEGTTEVLYSGYNTRARNSCC